MTMEPPPSSAQGLIPPPGLINLDRARQRFGIEKVDLIIELAHTGDARADAVIKEVEALGPEASHKLNLGISHGLKMVDTPPLAVRAFLEEAEHLPKWVDLERLKRGSEAFLSIGNIWMLLSLGPGSLTHTYSSASIASVLVRTGNLTKMAQRRLMETGSWQIASILPEGLLQGANGYIHNLQVRLLHARVRTTLLKRNWDTRTMGMPINQVEMTRTWLDFTYVPFDALQKFGITFTPDELADLYHFWQYIAYLLGIDERLYRNIMDQRSAQEVLELIDSTAEGANEDSKVLVQAMLEAVTNLLLLSMKLPASVAFDLVSAITRHLHGNKLADQLGIKRTWMSKIMPLITLSNRIQRAWNLRSAAARKRTVASTVHIFEQMPPLEGPTAYQHNADDPTQQHLPQMASGRVPLKR
jgi:hypothetical protein